MTGSSGVSGTLRPFDSITGASGILGRPVKPKPGDDTGRHPLTKSNTSFAFSAMMMAVLGPVKAELFEGRAFQTVEVAYPGSSLLKNMLRHFKRRDRLSHQK